MLEGARVAVVVPAYNEARLIETTLASMPSYVDLVIVVDDGSTDDTAARATSGTDPRVRLVRHTRNRGVGRAIATGYRTAFHAGAEVAAVMAGDGQMDPTELHHLVLPVARGETDYVKGNRLGFPQARTHMPWSRWVGNRVLAWATRRATGLPVRDSQCGYTALSRRAGERLPLERLWPGYGYPNDLLGAIAARKLRVREVVVRPVYGDEDSGIRWWHALGVVPYILLRVLARRVALRALLPGRRRLARSEAALPRPR